MLETYTTVLTDVSRNFYQNAKSSPVLYFWFTLMTFFSLLMMALLTVFVMHSDLEINLGDVFVIVFSIFMLKSGYEFHRHFITSPAVSYAFATAVDHKKTVFEIVLVVFWIQLGLWALFSIMYSIFLVLAGINLGYPIEYITFTLGVILAVVLGILSSLHFFSTKRYRLIPVSILGTVVWQYHENVLILLGVLCASLLYLAISLRYALDSYQFVKRKKRRKEQVQQWFDGIFKAISYKETIVMWRDNLFFTYILSSVMVGGFTGYMAAFGGEMLLPEFVQERAGEWLPTLYVILGCYIVTIFTGVFPALNMFLAEEKTVWFLRHLPLSELSIVKGKAYALILPFISTIPFIAFFVAFAGEEYLVYSIWFLSAAFLTGIALALPLGAKYIGKKSDVLVLYSVSMLLLIILSIIVGLRTLCTASPLSLGVFYISSLCALFGFVYLSVHLASYTLRLKQDKPMKKKYSFSSLK